MSLIAGGSTTTIPLPLAALICLTITYKLDRATERVLCIIGPSMQALAGSCPWPCAAVVFALWSQKLKCWGDFFLIRCCCTIFYNNNKAVVQLLKSCFSSFLGHGASPMSSNGLDALLGNVFGSHSSARLSCLPPGILFLRTHENVYDVTFLAAEIISLLMLSVKQISADASPRDQLEKLKESKCPIRPGQFSLAAAIARIKSVASFSASLVLICGGASLAQTLIKETLPSWFMCGHEMESDEGDLRGMFAMLQGYALAYLAVFCGAFAWGVDSTLPASKRRPSILRAHLEFLAIVLDEKISPRCGWPTLRAYVVRFLGLMVECMPSWLLGVDVNMLKRLSKGLIQWNEEELALALLVNAGIGAMGAAAELIIQSGE